MEEIDRIKYPYCVVEFLQEKQCIEAVPTDWVAQDIDRNMTMCYWPKEQIKKHVWLRTKPEDSWDMYEAKIVHYSSNYKAALASLKQYENSSDLELFSEPEMTFQQTPARLAHTPSRFTPISASLPSTSLTSARLSSPLPNATPSRSNYLPLPNAECSTCSDNNVILQKLFREVEILKEESKGQQRLLLQIAKKLDVAREERVVVEELPFNSLEELKDVEDQLAKERENKESAYFSKLVKFLGSGGGRDLSEVTRRILCGVISNKTACQLNWIGTQGKLGMKTCKETLLVICAAVRRTPATKNAQQADIEGIVKRWLRTAPDRDGGRVKRKALGPGNS